MSTELGICCSEQTNYSLGSGGIIQTSILQDIHPSTLFIHSMRSLALVQDAMCRFVQWCKTTHSTNICIIACVYKLPPESVH